MGRSTSPYYMDPAFAEVASNIAKIFVDPNPGSSARARYYNVQADDAARAYANKEALARRMAALNGGSVDPTTVGPSVANAFLAGMDPKQLGSGYRVYTSMAGRPDTEIGRAVVASGQLIGENDGVSLGDREAVAARADAARAQRSAIAAGPGYASVAESKRYHDQQLEWEKDKFAKTGQSTVGKIFFDENNPNLNDEQKRLAREAATRAARGSDRPVSVGQGAVLIDPRDGRVIATNPRAEGDKPHALAPGAVLVGPDGKVIARNDKPEAGFSLPPGGVRYDANGRPIAQNDKPPGPEKRIHVPAKEIGDTEWEVLRDAGALTDDGKSIRPEFLTWAGDRRGRALDALAETLSKTGNARAAQLAYMKELHLQTGDQFQPNGGISWIPWVGRPSGPPTVTRGGTPVEPPPAPAAANPTAGGPPAGATYPPAPPAAARQAGAVYATPRGPMKWTGTGWVPVGQ